MPQGIYEHARTPPAERFWPKVDRTGECWLWTWKMHGLHGQFWVDNKVAVHADRWAWEQKHGPVPEGLALIRSCGERRCVRPAHHWLGTKWDRRFWSRVDKGQPDECWSWTGTAKNNGYGAFGASIDGRRVSAAHRFSWVLHHGWPEHGLFVLHTCDNRLCVNPAHLWLGTAKDNTADMIAKGRHRFHPENLRPRRKAA